MKNHPNRTSIRRAMKDQARGKDLNKVRITQHAQAREALRACRDEGKPFPSMMLGVYLERARPEFIGMKPDRKPDPLLQGWR